MRQNVRGAVRAEVESLLRLADGRVDAPRDPVAAVARNLADDPDGSGGHSAPSTSAETRSPTV